MSLYGSLFAGVAGLQSQSNALSIISDNISNVNTVGYKATASLFQSLVTPNGSASQFSPGGVIGGNRALVDQQGLIQGTSSSTDIAISGNGFFVASAQADGSGTPYYTRAGSFTQDKLGNFVNSAGLYLKAWPLDRNGLLPGAPGNTTFTTSSADLGSLQVVNLKTTSGSASATSTISLSLNLNSGESIFPGATDTANMDGHSTNNSSVNAADLIVPNDYGAEATDLIRRGGADVGGASTDTGDTFTITTDTLGSAQSNTYVYGGFTASRSVSTVPPISVTSATFAGSAATDKKLVTVTLTGNLGPVNSTRYVNIAGLTPGSSGFADSDINGIHNITITGYNSTTNVTTFTYDADHNASGTAGSLAGTATVDTSPGDGGAGGTSGTPQAGNVPVIKLTSGTTFASGASGNQITVTFPSSLITAGVLSTLGPVGATRTIDIGGLTDTDVNSVFSGGAGAVNGPQTITVTSTGFTFNSSTAPTPSGSFTGADATVDDFAGNILDASSATTAFLSVSGVNPFTTSALSFTVNVGGAITHTFTYQASSPTADAGQFNNLTNLAAAMTATGDMTARVVSGRLYVSAVDANQSLTFANGDPTGDGVSKGGIDWVGELDLHNVAVDTNGNRFNSLDSLAAAINNTTTHDAAATVNNPTSNASLAITVKDPRGTLEMTDGASNTGSLLSLFGLTDESGTTLVSSLGGTFVRGDTGASNPEYDSGGTSGKNMASGQITPQFSRNVTIFDSQGAPHNVTTAYLKLATNTWAVEVYTQPASDITESGSLTDGQIAVGTIQFNGDGTLLNVSTGLSNPISVNWANGTSPSTITMDWGTAGPIGTGKIDGLSQFNADYSLNFINQNGAPVGQLTSVAVDAQGFIVATFTNGEVQKLYQIPIASFNNEDGLAPVSGNAFTESNSSGTFNLRIAGENGVGTISPSSLESSNVELSDQLTQMIVAQRAYEANTKIITTVDSLLQDLNQVIQ